MLFTEGHMFLVMLVSLYEVGDISGASFFSVLQGLTQILLLIMIDDLQKKRKQTFEVTISDGD